MKLRFATRKTPIRLAVFFLLLAGSAAIAWTIMLRMPGKSYQGPLPPLAREEEVLRDRLREAVETLAVKIGERNVYHPARLAAAADWIERELKAMGSEVHEEGYEVKGTPCRNLWAEAGARGGGRRGMLIVGAHYDSCPGAPGANDNATGVASLIEIARALRAAPPARTVRLVAFVNEEPPWFQTESMGSLVHARGCAARGESIAGMIALETMGYYTDTPGSQRYPWPLNYLYPDVGNFIGFVSNFGSRALVRAAIASFRDNTRFPSEGGAPPGTISGVGWSDHWSFWQIGVPAIMVTDTAPFRYPDYHQATDLPDKVDFERLARVTAGLIRVVAGLAATLP